MGKFTEISMTQNKKGMFQVVDQDLNAKNLK